MSIKIYLYIRKGLRLMTEFILAITRSLIDSTSSFSISPETDYNKHVPQNASRLMQENWARTGSPLYDAIEKVGEEIERQ